MPCPIPCNDSAARPAPPRICRGRVLLVVTWPAAADSPQYTGLGPLSVRPRGWDPGLPLRSVRPPGAGDAEEIARFCSLDYPVSFPLMAKCEVSGAQAHPFYRWLKQQNRGSSGARPSSGTSPRSSSSIRKAGWWTDSPQTKPEALAGAIEALL